MAAGGLFSKVRPSSVTTVLDVNGLYLADFVGWLTSCVISVPDLKTVWRRGPPWLLTPKSEKEQRISPLLPRLVPSPRYFAKFKLLQLWPRGADAGRPSGFRGCVPGRVVVDDAIFVRAEAAHTSLVERSR